MKPAYKWLAAASGLILGIFLVWYFHTIVFYILAAVVVSLIGSPIIKLLSRISIKGHTMPSWLSAAITLCLLGTLFLGLATGIVPILIENLTFLSTYDIHTFEAALHEPIQELEQTVNNLIPSIEFSIKEILLSKIEPFLASGQIATILNSLTSFVVNLFIAIFAITFISFFFLKDDQLFNEGVLMLFPKKYEANIQRAISSITNLLVRYFIGICCESAIKFICVTIPAYLLGLSWETAVIIGLVTAILNVIPYIGPILGAIIAFIIIAISPVEGVALTTTILQVGLVLLIFQIIDNIILQPYIYSSSVKAHPLEIFLVILMAGYIAGILGMLFAIPTYTVLRVIAKEFFNNLRVVQKLTERI